MSKDIDKRWWTIRHSRCCLQSKLQDWRGSSAKLKRFKRSWSQSKRSHKLMMKSTDWIRSSPDWSRSSPMSKESLVKSNTWVSRQLRSPIKVFRNWVNSPKTIRKNVWSVWSSLALPILAARYLRNVATTNSTQSA